MPITKRNAKRALQDKGFKEDNSRDHDYWFFYHNGKKTNCYTYFSHGSGRDIPRTIIKKMKRELQLDTDQQVRDLLNCPLSMDELVAILSSKGYI